MRVDLDDGDRRPWSPSPAATIDEAAVRPDGAVWFRHEQRERPRHGSSTSRAARCSRSGRTAAARAGRSPVSVRRTRRRADPRASWSTPEGEAPSPPWCSCTAARTGTTATRSSRGPGVRRRGLRRAARELPRIHGLRRGVPRGPARRHRLPRVGGHHRRARPRDRPRPRRPRDASRSRAGPGAGTSRASTRACTPDGGARRSPGSRWATSSPPTTSARPRCGRGTSPSWAGARWRCRSCSASGTP